MANRNAQLGQIHIAKKDLGMDDETYRDFMANHCNGITSAADLDMHGRFKLIQAFKDAGWKPKTKRYPTKRKSYEHATSRLMIVKWRELAKAGFVNDNSAEAMEAWIANQTNKPGQDIPKKRSPDTLNAKLANELIERLKRWIER